jgi:hypothetical protein
LSAIVRDAGLFSSTWTVTFSKPEAIRWYWQRVLYNRRPHCLANGHVLVTRIVCGQGKSTYRSICALGNVSVERMTTNGRVKPPVVRLKRALELSAVFHPS